MENYEKDKIAKEEMLSAIITLLVCILIVAIMKFLDYMEELNYENHISDDNIKINAFKNDKKFICKSFAGEYLVSEDQNWSTYNEYFKKNDFLIPIYSCTENIK